MDSEVAAGFESRYKTIKNFQKITSSLFQASLRGDADPEIAKLVINELPDQYGFSHHKDLYQSAEKMSRDMTPVFF